MRWKCKLSEPTGSDNSQLPDNIMFLYLTVYEKELSQLQSSRLHLKCDGTRAGTRFRLSVKRTSPFISAGGRQFSRLPAAEVCASAVVMLDTPCSEVVWRVLATHCIRQFSLHFPSRASLCAITFQLDSNRRKILCNNRTNSKSSNET